MNEELSGLVAKLKEKGVEFRLTELNDRAMTVADVIRFSKGDIEREEICKTLIVKAGKGFVAVFLKGEEKLDIEKLRKFLNLQVRIARVDEVRDIAKAKPGAVCPLLLSIPLIVDKGVLNLERINFGSGDHLYGLEVKTKDFLSLREMRIADVSEGTTLKVTHN